MVMVRVGVGVTVITRAKVGVGIIRRYAPGEVRASVRR